MDRENMELFFQREKPKAPSYLAVEGMVVELRPIEDGRRAHRADCGLFAAVENSDGNIVNFLISPGTYVAEYVTLKVGMEAVFYYSADAPAPLIYPPQFGAAVVVPKGSTGGFVAVGSFGEGLVNREQTLRLMVDDSVEVVTINNQKFLGYLPGHDLAVFYENSTRSIPAQTTPKKIVVLCRR